MKIVTAIELNKDDESDLKLMTLVKEATSQTASLLDAKGVKFLEAFSERKITLVDEEVLTAYLDAITHVRKNVEFRISKLDSQVKQLVSFWESVDRKWAIIYGRLFALRQIIAGASSVYEKKTLDVETTRKLRLRGAQQRSEKLFEQEVAENV